MKYVVDDGSPLRDAPEADTNLGRCEDRGEGIANLLRSARWLGGLSTAAQNTFTSNFITIHLIYSP